MSALAPLLGDERTHLRHCEPDPVDPKLPSGAEASGADHSSNFRFLKRDSSAKAARAIFRHVARPLIDRRSAPSAFSSHSVLAIGFVQLGTFPVGPIAVTCKITSPSFPCIMRRSRGFGI
jgi:hypothetical protein